MFEGARGVASVRANGVAPGERDGEMALILSAREVHKIYRTGTQEVEALRGAPKAAPDANKSAPA